MMGANRWMIGMAAALLVWMSSAAPAGAATIRRVPADYPSIQAAINAAVNGDTVLVSAGTYVENIDFLGKAITVRSVSGAQNTIIDGNAAGSVVTFASGEGRNSVLQGFTLRNGRSGFDTPGFGDGGGVRIDNASPRVTRNVIINNQACAGAGISIDFGSPLIQGNTISNNVQAGCSGGTGGGGISVGGAGSAQIIGNVISNNVLTSASGGGISLFAAGTPVIRDNMITGNSASGLSPCAEGGGIWLVNQSDALIVNNMITNNSAGCGGGVFWLVPSGAPGPKLVNNTIANNTASDGSSGVFADGFDAQTLLANNIIVAAGGQTAVFCGNFNDLNPPVFSYNDVYSATGPEYGGICTDQTGFNGNISADPLFRNAAGGDFHLSAGSPAIDAGTNSAPNLPSRDIDRQPRILDGNADGVAIVDIGADEYRAK